MAAMFRSAPEMRSMMADRGVEWPVLDAGEMMHLMAFIQSMRQGDKPER
jgi:hypothetical protein